MFTTWLIHRWTKPALTLIPPESRVFDAAAAIIHDRKVAKVEDFIRNVEIWHPWHPLLDEFGECHWDEKICVIRQLCDMPRTVPIRVFTKWRWVEVRTGGRWMALREYLDQLNMSALSRSVMDKRMCKEEGYVQLSKWWKFRGSKARSLFSLPRELRNIIYGYVLGPDVTFQIYYGRRPKRPRTVWITDSTMIDDDYNEKKSQYMATFGIPKPQSRASCRILVSLLRIVRYIKRVQKRCGSKAASASTTLGPWKSSARSPRIQDSAH